MAKVMKEGYNYCCYNNASKNIRAEGIRQLLVVGTRTTAEGGEVRAKGGRKSVLSYSSVSSESPTKLTL